eukprot:TRINITY_DN6427_c0_g3_i1.p1 TRINITY_DN6427_c0_g3~~TRINITY_DN6427_c0_g3_i1.p1  ORF type:complete len:146 (+),score=19.18 TRINITY_DN6427_c0_g3_i1:102-539(+)
MRSYSVNLLLFLLLSANGCLLFLNKFDEQPAVIFTCIADSLSKLTNYSIDAKPVTKYAEHIRAGIAITYCILALGYLLRLNIVNPITLVLSVLMILTIDNPLFNKPEYYKEIAAITHILIIGIIFENTCTHSIQYDTDLSKIKLE